jgi:hypothetical protein
VARKFKLNKGIAFSLYKVFRTLLSFKTDYEINNVNKGISRSRVYIYIYIYIYIKHKRIL